MIINYRAQNSEIFTKKRKILSEYRNLFEHSNKKKNIYNC